MQTAKILSIVYPIFYGLTALASFLFNEYFYGFALAIIAFIAASAAYFLRNEKLKYAEWLFAIAGVLTLPIGGPLAACAMTVHEERQKIVPVNSTNQQ